MDLRARLATAINETEVRDRFCGEVYKYYGITFRLERGRSDARLNRTILEFKNKGSFGGKIHSAKFKEAFSQLTQKYIPDQAKKEGAELWEYIGVAIDGQHYAFVFFEEDGKARHTALIGLDVDGLPLLLDAFLRDKRRPFTTENLLEDFGPGSELAREVLHQLWQHLNGCLDSQESEAQKVKMLFQEWKKLFAQTTNFGRLGQERIDTYLQRIGFGPPIDYTRALFVLHTYNALLFKFIAAELVTTIRYKDYSGFASEAGGSHLSELREMLDNRIEHAEIFRANGIENFIEGSFFSWYLEKAPDDLLLAIRKMLSQLGWYIFPRSAQRRVRDVVKDVYQYLVPEALRKNIGEFYTPEWLVDFVLDRVNYKGSLCLKTKILDPCCGSGNFLIHAIDRYKQAAREQGWEDKEIANSILQHVIGFDLNPLAVLSARLNYLLAIADILPSSGRIEIPVYLADAVYAPEQHRNGNTSTRVYSIGTVLGNITLELPEDLVQQRILFGEILSVMERDVEVHETKENFIAHLQQNPAIRPILEKRPDWVKFLTQMYDKVYEMEKRNWNRIWCRIVRNYFASVAIGKVDIIVGNPPWVRWSELPKDYRERIKPTCDQYGIFSQTPFFGGNELDISGMIAYTVTDKWLAKGGSLGFVITQIHFQAPSSEGFRQFRLPGGEPLCIKRVDDFTDVRPFPNLTNKPAVFTWERGEETRYPVEYVVWKRRKGVGSIPEDADLEEVLNEMIEPNYLLAVPLPPDRRWSILSPKEVGLIKKLGGGSKSLRGRKGITTDLNAAYFVRIIGPGSTNRCVKVTTSPEIGRKPVPKLDAEIEHDLIYPLLKGAEQIGPFSFTPGEYVAIVPNRSITSMLSEEEFRKHYPHAYRYFRRINGVKDSTGTPLLENRSTWRTRMKPAGAPFYAIYNVGKYTFAPYKVVWAEIAKTLVAAVVSSQELPYGLGEKPIVPDHKIYFVPLDDEDQAHFLCALLNSEPVRTFVDSFTVKTQVGTLFRHLRLPSFVPADPTHSRLVELSKKAHSEGITDEIQSEIDRLVVSLLSVANRDRYGG